MGRKFSPEDTAITRFSIRSLMREEFRDSSAHTIHSLSSVFLHSSRLRSRLVSAPMKVELRAFVWLWLLASSHKFTAVKC